MLSVGALLDFKYSADGQRLIALGSSGLEVLDATSGQSRLQVKFGPRGEWLAVKPSGEILATEGASDQFQVFEPGGKRQSGRPENGIQPHGSSFFGNRGRIDAVAHAADQTATFGHSGGPGHPWRPMATLLNYDVSNALWPPN